MKRVCAQVVLADILGRGGSGVVYLGEWWCDSEGPLCFMSHGVVAEGCALPCSCCRRMAVPAGGGQDPGV